MTNSFLDVNLNFIKKYNPSLVQKINNHTSLQANFNLVDAASGDVNLLRENIAVHDAIDPVMEAVQLYDGVKDKLRESINIIYGIGLGYVFKRFVKRSEGYVILYEPDLDFLRIAFELVDFSEELSKKNVRVVNTYEDLEQIYSEIFFQGYKLNLSYLNYHKYYFMENLNDFIAKISDLHGIYESNYKTLFDKSLGWNNSIIRNIPDFINYQGIGDLPEVFKNKPAVIISAGPSLDKNINEIKNYRDKVAVFCVGTALKAAVKNGIIPDFVCVVEYFLPVMSQVNDVDLSETNLILHVMAYNDLFKIKSNRIFNYYSNNDNSSKWIASKLGKDISMYFNKGTVSANAIYSAQMLGCNPIILIGQDFAYSEGKCYSEDSVYSDFKLTPGTGDSKEVVKTDIDKTTEKLRVARNAIEAQVVILNKNLIQVKGINGEMLTTRSDFALCIKYFEMLAKEMGDSVSLINATEGGAYIDGFKYMTLKEALESNVNESFSVNKVISEYVVDNKKILQDKKIIIGELKNTKIKCKKLIEICSKFKLKKAEDKKLFEEDFRYCYDQYKTLKDEIDGNFLILNAVTDVFLALENHIKIFEINDKDRACFIEKVEKLTNSIKSLLPGVMNNISDSIIRLENQ